VVHPRDCSGVGCSGLKMVLGRWDTVVVLSVGDQVLSQQDGYWCRDHLTFMQGLLLVCVGVSSK
jgi:hypothetical protein